MSIVDEIHGRVAGTFRIAILAERRAAGCSRDLAGHFEDRGMEALCALCRRLSANHDAAIEAMRAANADGEPGEEAWIRADGRELLLRVAGARQLLEIALANESGMTDLYDGIAAAEWGEDDRALAAGLADRARAAAREVTLAMESVHAPPDWESLISSGAVPALALGAERRMRR
jgi:hypothetical protein